MLKLSTLNWLKVFSPLAIAASIFLATEVPVNAVPRISVSGSRHSSGSFYRHKTVSPSSSLNITPRSGTHIPLTRSPRSYYYRSNDYRRGRDRSRYRGYRRGRDRYRYYDDCRRRDRYRGRRRSYQGRRRYGSYKKGYGGLIIINPGRRY